MIGFLIERQPCEYIERHTGRMPWTRRPELYCHMPRNTWLPEARRGKEGKETLEKAELVANTLILDF